MCLRRWLRGLALGVLLLICSSAFWLARAPAAGRTDPVPITS